MSQARAGGLSPRRVRSRPRPAWPTFRRTARRCGRQLRAAWRHAHWSARLAAGATLLIALWVPVNLAYQVIQKPSELLAPLSDWLNKTPDETWSDYAPLFHRYATGTITPELLAALAQVESAGNPVATSYWRWRFSLNPFAIYRPASSSVGMFQTTDGTLAEARHYCIRDHRVEQDSPYEEADPCGMSGIYSRIFPSDAVEITAAYLDRKLAALTAKRKAALTIEQRNSLVVMIHLCGPKPAADYLRRGFHLTPGERCGDQDVAAYIARVGGFERQFTALPQAGEP